MIIVSSESDNKVHQLGDQIAKLTSIQAGSLLSYLKNTYDIEPIETAHIVTESGHTETVIIDEPEQTIFDVILTSAGDKKIFVVKEVRAVTNLGLKESKELVESVPKRIKEGIPKAEAEKIKAIIEAVGGKVELK